MIDEQVTIEEMYDASDYLEWLTQHDREETEQDLHWQRVWIEIDNEAYMNEIDGELPF